MSEQSVTRLYPAPMVSASLNGLYLREDLTRLGRADRPFIYTNFIASLDGRVAVRGLGESSAHIPPSLANGRDWRLYQELAAQADVIVVSAGHARAMAHNPAILPFPFCDPADVCDLKQWRLEHGRAESPTVAVATSSLDLPFEALHKVLPQGFVCVSGKKALAKARAPEGVRILRAGPGTHATGNGLARALGDEGWRAVYSVAGPGIMKTLLQDRVLDRLYLTQVSRLIGGSAFDTLVEAPGLNPPVDLDLITLYQDCDEDYAQTFAVYDVEPPRD